MKHQKAYEGLLVYFSELAIEYSLGVGRWRWAGRHRLRNRRRSEGEYRGALAILRPLSF